MLKRGCIGKSLPAIRRRSTSPASGRPDIDIFFSYSHLDEKLRDKLEKHLTSLKRNGMVRVWYDRRIGAGSDVGSTIDAHIQSADLILILVSVNFLASDYCFSNELTVAMDRHRQGKARVIPIILRPVDWRDAPFRNLLALPKDGKPITTWSNPDAAFFDVAQGIRNAVEEISGRKGRARYSRRRRD